MNRKIRLMISLLLAALSGCNTRNDNFISYEESDKRVRMAVDSVLQNKAFTEKETRKIGIDTLRAFMRAYRDRPLAIVDMQHEIVKGFFIGDKIIDFIKQDSNSINGLYVYFGKKIFPYVDTSSPATSPELNGKYTIIVIPSIPSERPGEDRLLYQESLEWHDPVTRLAHTPINENEIYNPNK